MQLSEDTKRLLDAMDSFTGYSLRKKNDFGAVFELAAGYGLVEIMEKIIFESAIVWKLSSKIKKTSADEENSYLLRKEFENSTVKLAECLKEIAQYAENETKLRFEETYYGLSRGSILNLIDLAHDFASFKDLQRTVKDRKTS